MYTRAQVALEQVHVGKGLAAFVAGEGLLAGVLLLVHIALLLRDEAETAAWIVAFVRLELGMAMEMAGKFWLGVEGAAIAA